MQIKRLRLSGFKSFVEPADLRIECGLTGVVGPNGCGKSNLLEALRWAMAENSAKSMRGAGMDDVIFAGTATRPARDFAEVSILTELAGPAGIGETEVVRRIERGAGSAYRIDGRDVRAKEVALLFADAATGAHSPALVSQGRIGAVIAAKPADRRQLLEEAAGISGLYVRRRDAEQKLRATAANLARLDEIITDQGVRAAALRRQARQAERYRELSDKIRLAEARLIFARWREAAAAAAAAQADGVACEAQVAAAAETHRIAADEQVAAARGLDDARTAALTARDRASEAGHRLTTLRAEQGVVERRLAELIDTQQRIATDRTREGALAHDAAEALARLAAAAAASTGELAQTEAALPLLEAARATAESRARDAEVALAQALTRQAGEAADARVAAAALAAAQVRLDRAQRDARQIAEVLTQLGEPDALEVERAAAIEVLACAMTSAATAHAMVSEAERSQHAALAERDLAQADRSVARADLAALDSEAAALERATRRGGRDRLLDQICAAPGYERALAAALGDDLEAGLDPAADRFWQGASATAGDPGPAEGTAPLADRVSAPPQLARRLAQILVADADAGQPLAVGQRLVTRDGGARRWDGFVARVGGAGAAERLERVNRLAAIADMLPAARDRTTAAEAAFGKAEAAINAARVAARTAQAAMRAGEAAARDGQQRVDRAANRLERLAGQRADLIMRAARISADHDDAASEMANAAAAPAALPDPAATAALVGTLQREADECRTAVAQARAARGAHDRLVGTVRERLAAGVADTRSWKARASDAAERIADMATREAALTRELATLTDRPAALGAEIAELDAGHTAARATAAALAATERVADAAVRAAAERARAAGETLSEAREARAGAAARTEHAELRRVELGRVAGERFACPAPVLPRGVGFAAADVAAPAAESAAHERLILDRERIGPINLVAEAELAELDQSAAASAAERDELSEAVNRLQHSIGTLNREGRQRLLAAFAAVDAHFRRLFTTLFAGGEAHLALVDSEDPLEAGLEIMAQPPGKKLQSLTLLSGGEQALTAVALIFGLFLTNPAPICVLDEVDAPLDDANIERFCDLLDAMTRATKTRYLIVTHNAVTMSRMDRLFGVTMVEQGVSRLVSVDLGGAETLLAAE